MVIGQYSRLVDEAFFDKVTGEYFMVDTEAVQNDIERLEQLESNPQISGIERKEVHKLIKDLIKLLGKCKNNYKALKIDIDLKDGIMEHSIPFRNVDRYGIRTDKYLKHMVPIKRKQKKLSKVYIDLNQMADLISFEMLKNDLGYSDKEIELKLKKANLLSANNIEDYFDFSTERPYYMSKIMAIGESEYAEDEVMHDYFELYEFYKDKYIAPVAFSCRYAALFLLEKLKAEFSTVYLCSIYETGLCIMTDADERRIKAFLNEDILIRVAKRKFRVNIPYEFTEYTEEEKQND